MPRRTKSLYRYQAACCEACHLSVGGKGDPEDRVLMRRACPPMRAETAERCTEDLEQRLAIASRLHAACIYDLPA